MALLKTYFRSSALNLEMCMDVILPEKKQYPGKTPRRDYPVLYLLHGLSDDNSAWTRKTRIESYVQDMDIAVVMPTTHRGFYTNTLSGYKYFDFVADELPAICASMFPISTKREDTFAAGLSMGGYGALKLGILRPENYCAVASLSGVTDIADTMRRRPETEFVHIFGQDLANSENDLVYMAQKLIDSGEPLPMFYQACGMQDGLYPMNRAFYERFGQALNIKYEEGPGVHNWDFWDEYIRRVLKWLPIRKEQ